MSGLDYGALLQAGRNLVPDMRAQLFQREQIEMAREGQEFRREQDLAKVASGQKEAGKSMNFSNTGGPLGWVVSGGVLTASASVTPWAATLLALHGLSGAILASPKLARWLAKMPAQPGAQRRHVQALTKIASAEPVIATEALGLQRQLLERFSAEPARLAAETGEAPRSSADRGAETTRTGQAPR